MNISSIYKTLLIGILMLSSCSEDTPAPTVEIPATYTFERNGQNTVDFSGQTTRIAMATALVSALSDHTVTKAQLLAMYAHEEGVQDFADAALNASSKNIITKTAGSVDYAAMHTSADVMAVRNQIMTWIAAQHDEVFPAWKTAAAAGQAGQLIAGTKVRYVSAEGLEYNQLIAKTLIGALMTDQILNHYLSEEVLDAVSNRDQNDAATTAEGKAYTTMEHCWDEAYGYAYGASVDPANPNATLGDDHFLNNYIGTVSENPAYAQTAAQIFDAFKTGRAAIVAHDYITRDLQVAYLRTYISKVIAIRAVHYLQSGKKALAAQDFGGAFHDLSEGLGFMYSLQFTRKSDTLEPYFTKTEVDVFMNDILANENGLWNASATTLDEVTDQIVQAFDLVLAEAIQ